MNFIDIATEKRLHAISHKELAVTYFPDVNFKNASRRLKTWIMEDKELVRLLESHGWTPNKRLLTPIQVQCIINAFGKP